MRLRERWGEHNSWVIILGHLDGGGEGDKRHRGVQEGTNKQPEHLSVGL